MSAPGNYTVEVILRQVHPTVEEHWRCSVPMRVADDDEALLQIPVVIADQVRRFYAHQRAHEEGDV